MDKSNAVCDWSTYKYCNGSSTTMTKYNSESYYGIVDNIETLEAKDDAATQFMGDGWRMPTKADFDELSVNTDSEWVTNYNGSGVNGYKFTSNKEGYQNNSIFIPNSGYRSYETFSDQGKYGYLWCTRLNEAFIHAGQIYYFESMSSPSMKYRFMDTGLAIRPVLTPQTT